MKKTFSKEGCKYVGNQSDYAIFEGVCAERATGEIESRDSNQLSIGCILMEKYFNFADMSATPKHGHRFL